MNKHEQHVCHAVPPHILEALTRHKDPKIAKAAMTTLVGSAVFRAQRLIIGPMAAAMQLAVGERRRTVYDAQRGSHLPGKFVRGEKSDDSGDKSVDDAYKGAGHTYDFLREAFGRNSLDGAGMRLDSTVHYQEDPTEGYDNAFWNGRQMVYGDGSGVFGNFTACLEIIGHELVHGLTEFTAGLIYENQPGALNEHVSDAFGSMVKQWVLKQNVEDADWLIGAGLLTSIPGALRSMKAPGTAYNDPQLGGKDPQPDHMSNYQQLPNTRFGDWGGVHINSGIPNRAFYLACMNLGAKYSWEKAGPIWYRALTSRMNQTSSFVDAKAGTVSVARELFGDAEAQAVLDAWNAVGV